MNTAALKTAAPQDNPAVDATLPSALAALDGQARRTLRIAGGVVACWLAMGLVWSLAAPISGGVVANGLVKVETNRRTVTHRDGGTVAKILVREGQSVEKGQILIELEDIRVEASVDLLRGQLAGERLRQARLEAEAAGQTQWVVPPALLESFKDVKRLGELSARENASFRARQTHLAAQIAGDQRQADDTRKEIEVRLRERENSGRAMQLMRDELVLNEKLAAEQFVHKSRLMSLQRAVSEYESRQLSNEAELSQARQRLGGLDAHMAALRDAQRQAASDELRDVAARVSDIEQRLRASTDDQSRQTIVAPEAGRLLNLRINTPGSALGPREPVVDIVPLGTPLTIEARLPLEVGAEIKVGDEAEVKLLTAHARYEKLLPAKVVQVAADAQEDQRSGAAFLTMRVELLPEAAAAGTGATLQPGQAAEIYVKVAERTPVGFLLEPIAGYFRRAFREH